MVLSLVTKPLRGKQTAQVAREIKRFAEKKRICKMNELWIEEKMFYGRVRQKFCTIGAVWGNFLYFCEHNEEGALLRNILNLLLTFDVFREAIFYITKFTNKITGFAIV